jgi:hypothetical protein
MLALLCLWEVTLLFSFLNHAILDLGIKCYLSRLDGAYALLSMNLDA